MRLEATGLAVRAGRRLLVEGVSLRLCPGEVTALVGPNGAGKSTLLAALSGHRRADAGEVRLGERRLADWPARRLARRRAVLTQDSDLEFAFTVDEVVSLGRAPYHGLSSQAADRAIVAAAMRLAQVEHLAERSYPTLSGGERQRAMLARVLAQILEPDGDPAGRWLLLDEPTASLDLTHQKLVMSLAARLAAQGAGVLVVLHDLNLAARFADRVAMLDQGSLVALGDPEEVLTAERVGRVYGVGVRRTAIAGRPYLTLA